MHEKGVISVRKAVLSRWKRYFTTSLPATLIATYTGTGRLRFAFITLDWPRFFGCCFLPSVKAYEKLQLWKLAFRLGKSLIKVQVMSNQRVYNPKWSLKLKSVRTKITLSDNFFIRKSLSGNNLENFSTGEFVDCCLRKVSKKNWVKQTSEY